MLIKKFIFQSKYNLKKKFLWGFIVEYIFKKKNTPNVVAYKNYNYFED